MIKTLEDTEAASSRAMKKLSEKQKIIQEKANLIKEKEKESSSEGRNDKDKEKERAHAEMTQRLKESEALSTKRESTADKIKRKGKQGNLGGCRKSERETAGSCRDCKKA